MLKQKEIGNIDGLKSRVNEQEGAISKRDAIIAAQTAELEAVIGILRDNGLAQNLVI